MRKGHAKFHRQGSSLDEVNGKLCLDYVLREGSQSLKTSLQSWLHYQCNDQKIPLIAKQSGKQIMILPAHFAHFILERPKKPQWLYQDENACGLFFQGKSELLMQLTQLSKANPPLANRQRPETDPRFQQLHDLQQQLNEALAEDGPTTFWKTLFYPRRKQFAKRVAEFLQTQQQQAFKQQCLLLNEIKKWAPIEHCYHEPYFSATTRLSLQAMLAGLEKQLENKRYGEALKNLFCDVQRDVNQLITQDEQFAEKQRLAHQTIKAYAQGRDVQLETSNKLLAYLEGLGSWQKQAWQQQYRSEISQIYGRLEKQFLGKLTTNIAENCKSKFDGIHRLALILRQCSDSAMQENINGLIATAILHYQKFMDGLPALSHEHNLILIEYESLLDALAKQEQIPLLLDMRIKRQELLACSQTVKKPAALDSTSGQSRWQKLKAESESLNKEIEASLRHTEQLRQNCQRLAAQVPPDPARIDNAEKSITNRPA